MKYSIGEIHGCVMNDNCFDSSLEEIEATFTSVLDVFCQLIRRLPKRNPFNIKCLHMGLSVLFTTASIYKKCFSAEENLVPMADERVDRMFATVEKLVKDVWIDSNFTPVFGAPGNRGYSTAKDDVQVYDYFRN